MIKPYFFMRFSLFLSCLIFLGLSTVPTLASPIPGLYNTGVNDAKELLDQEQEDPHYTITADTIQATLDPKKPIIRYPDGSWHPNNSLSQWIIPPVLTRQAGTWRFRTTFSLQNFDLNTVRIFGRVAVDDNLGGILINGKPVPMEEAANKTLRFFLINTNFVAGENSLEFILQDIGGNAGIRVEMIGEGCPPSTAKPLIDVHPKGGELDTGSTLALGVQVSCGNPTYQWRYNQQNIPGATSPALVLTNVQPAQSGTYDVRVSNANGETLSLPAVISIADPKARLSIRPEFEDFLTITVQGKKGKGYTIEYRDAFNAESAWTPLETLTLQNESYDRLEGPLSGLPLQRFYRALTLASETQSSSQTLIIRMEKDSILDGNETTGIFIFDKVPPTSSTDLGQMATFTVISGALNNALSVAKANDGVAQKDSDVPGESIWSDNPWRLLADLGEIKTVSQVNTYSWHAQFKADYSGNRSPQFFTLYASDGTNPGFNSSDPASPGWIQLGTVDSTVLGKGGQQGTSIQDLSGTLGRFRYFMWDIYKAPDHGGTFFGEMDIVGP